jgi:hypothetical protein
MAHSIFRLGSKGLTEYAYYFFDANIWIAHLLPTHDTRPYIEKYRIFFDRVVEQAMATNQPSIIVTSMLISEICNTYLRISFKAYRKEHESCKDYKWDYRPSEDFQCQLEKFKTDFAAFKPYIVLEDDYCQKIDPFSILPEMNGDFNDLYYFYNVREIMNTKKSLAIVTNDGDFVFSGVTILTENNKLLK